MSVASSLVALDAEIGTLCTPAPQALGLQRLPLSGPLNLCPLSVH